LQVFFVPLIPVYWVDLIFWHCLPQLKRNFVFHLHITLTEQRELKLRKKQREQQMKHEEQMSKALKIWNTQILPLWETA
jgi:hypothetical protein